MFRVGILPLEPLLHNPNPNPYNERYFNACLFRQITVGNDLTGNQLSLTHKLNN